MITFVNEHYRTIPIKFVIKYIEKVCLEEIANGNNIFYCLTCSPNIAIKQILDIDTMYNDVGILIYTDEDKNLSSELFNKIREKLESYFYFFNSEIYGRLCEYSLPQQIYFQDKNENMNISYDMIELYDVKHFYRFYPYNQNNVLTNKIQSKYYFHITIKDIAEKIKINGFIPKSKNKKI